VLWLWAWELVTALVIATPIHTWARAAWGSHPDGDAPLFRPGGHSLISWLDAPSPALPIVVRTTLLLVLVTLVLSPLVTGAVVAGLVTDEDDGRPARLGRALRTALPSILPLGLLGALALAFQIVLVGLGIAAAAGTESALHESLGDATAFALAIGVFVLFFALVLVIGVVADLARVIIVRGRVAAPAPSAIARLRDGLQAALRTSGRARGRGLASALASWGWRAAIAFLLLLAGAAASDVAGDRGGGALFGLFALHQVVMLARAGRRTSWLKAAIAISS
jgi:hypothetical protein